MTKNQNIMLEKEATQKTKEKRVATKKAMNAIDLDALATQPPEEKKIQLSFSVSEKEYRNLTILAERKNESVASYIRKALVAQSKISDNTISLNVSAEDLQTIKAMAARTNDSVASYLRRTIATHKYFRDLQDEGKRIIVEGRRNVWGDRERTEVVLDAKEPRRQR
jgi:tRNA threonylcarbamoyladenosine modification (KEOPS) complex  Pcc1 subunit